MATITPQTISAPGTAITLAAANAGDVVANALGAKLIVRNAGGSSMTVTLTQQLACSLGSNTPTHDLVVTVAAGAEEAIPINQSWVDSSGNAHLSYSTTTSVTVGAHF